LPASNKRKKPSCLWIHIFVTFFEDDAMTMFRKIALTTCASLAVALPLRADEVFYAAHLVATPFGGTGVGALHYAFDTDPLDYGPVRLNLGVQDVPADRVLVLANNELFGPLDLTSGSGQLTLDARQGDYVPTLGAGSGIVITDADTGVPLLIGVLELYEPDVNR
jgi:hypothetical protein